MSAMSLTTQTFQNRSEQKTTCLRYNLFPPILLVVEVSWVFFWMYVRFLLSAYLDVLPYRFVSNLD